MGRKLSTVDIMGTLFEVDASREELRQKDDALNRIPFHVFDQEGDGYRFLYDPQHKNLPVSKKAIMEAPEMFCWVIVPALMELDPEGIAMRYDIPIEVLCPEDKDRIPKEINAIIRPVLLSSKLKNSKK